MTHRGRWMTLVAGIGLWAILGGVGFGSTEYQGDEILQPPKRLQWQTPLKDTVGCTDCARGPYILDTDEKGTVPQDLTRLVVELKTALPGTGNEFVLLISTEYSVSGGELRVPERAVACVSDRDLGGNLGWERCEWGPGRRERMELQQIRGRPIYIFVINYGPRNHEFTLIADWEPSPSPCSQEPCLPLESNKPETKVIAANGFTFEIEPGKAARLFEFNVPSGATAIALRVRSSNPKEVNVDAYIGKNLKPEEKPEEKAKFALVSELGEEAIIQLQPEPGRYWLAVRNRTDNPQAVEVVVTVLMDLRDLPPDGKATGQIGLQTGLLPLLVQYLRSASGTLAPTQYKITLKSEDLVGVLGLQITLRGSGGLSLYLRFGRIIEVRNEQIIADLFLIGPATEKTAVLSGALLKPGEIYLAVAASGTLPQTYEIEAKLIKPGPFENQVVRVPLDPVEVHVSGGR